MGHQGPCHGVSVAKASGPSQVTMAMPHQDVPESGQLPCVRPGPVLTPFL